LDNYTIITLLLISLSSVHAKNNNNLPHYFISCWHGVTHFNPANTHMDIHVKLHKTEIHKKSVINMGTKVYNNMGTEVYNNMGTKVYNNLPGFIKEIDNNKAFKKDLKLFLFLHTFYSVEKFVSS